MILLLISLLAGALTVLAPCVLPLLPIIVSGSLNGQPANKSRPYVIAVSLAASIIAFTLLLKVSTVLVNLSPDVLTTFSGGLLVALGLVTIFPEAWELVVIKVGFEVASQRFLGAGQRNRSRFLGPILIGIALGPVFSSCSPTYAFILASILPKSFASGLIYLVTYVIGLVLALLAVALVGRKFISRFRWAVDTHSVFRRCTGVLFVVIGLVILFGREVPVETWVANHLPFDETKIEQVLLSTQHRQPAASTNNAASDFGVLNVTPTPEPELVGLTNWINSPALTLAGLRGKVVLVDFWTYSCINCIRSIPYVEKWYETYQSKGLVIIGVSTPEFAFEHVPSNVQAAVKKDGITYPVALDNNYETWNAFNNDSWPADYLIDKSGNIRYVSLGEGDYDKTERAIQALLGTSGALTTSNFHVPYSELQTPETYFGTNRDADYSGSPDLTDGTFNFKSTGTLPQNGWALNGNWQISPEYITSQSNGSTLTFSVYAKDVYVVAGNAGGASQQMKVSLPAANSGQYGSDANGGVASINGSRLYHIVSLPQAGTTTVTLTVPKGVSLYTFTFGS
ncbi:MAG TPA: redoxin family protein [Candidatus Saccharimonadia bacterium]|nr:redoxin family protein [Candidatus Saccharimonadia bacterium]